MNISYLQQIKYINHGKLILFALLTILAWTSVNAQYCASVADTSMGVREEIMLEELTNGIYLLNITINGKETSLKIVKQ